MDSQVLIDAENAEALPKPVKKLKKAKKMVLREPGPPSCAVLSDGN